MENKRPVGIAMVTVQHLEVNQSVIPAKAGIYDEIISFLDSR